jgi:hypothetical protein
MKQSPTGPQGVRLFWPSGAWPCPWILLEMNQTVHPLGNKRIVLFLLNDQKSQRIVQLSRSDDRRVMYKI